MAPAKSASKKSETQQVAQPVAQAPKEEVKKASKKTTKTEQAPVAETPKEVKQTKKAASKKETVAVQEEQPQQEEQPRQKRVVSKESVDATFTALTEKIIAEIERLREAKPKAKGVKFLKTLNKEIKQLHSDCNRVTRFRKNSERKNTTPSGFTKPVNISAELAKFTGRDVNQPCSRTEITKFICNYIKSKKLYDEKDKRNILCDAALNKLLKCDTNPPKDEQGNVVPLTYFRLQQYLKSHFKAIPKASEEDLE